MEMGTGKTRSTLAYCQKAESKRILIGCPISAAGAWRNEIKKLGLGWQGMDLTQGSLLWRAAMLRKHAKRVQVVLINFNVLWAPKGRALRDTRKRVRSRANAQKQLIDAIDFYKPDTVILDEAHRIKGRNTRQSMYAAVLAKKPYVRRRIALTGTPVAQGIEDLFAIYRFIDPTVFGTRWATFQSRYLRMGGYYNHNVVGYMNEDEIKAKVDATAFTISKSDALDLPERQDAIVPFKLSPKARRLYDKFKKEMLAEIEGLDENGKPKSGTALARIMLTTIIRLQQMTSGFVNSEEGIINISSDKLDATADLVEDAVAEGHSVVIFCRFRHDVSMLRTRLAEYGCSRYVGGMTGTERDDALADFRSGKNKVFIADISAGSESIDLTVSNIAIFYSLNHSLKDYAQARDRLHRHGQTKKVTYYLMQAERSIDEEIFNRLQSKQDIARMISNLDYARRILQ